MSELPDGWSQVTLEELVARALGGDWGKEPSFESEEYVDVSVVRGADYRNWAAIRASGAAHRKIKRSSLEKRRLAVGDLVLEVSGGGPTQPVGRVLLVDGPALESAENPLVCGNFCRQLSLTDAVLPQFLSFVLQSSYNRGELNAFQSQTTNLRNLSVPRFLAEHRVPIPPLQEQQRIVTKINALSENSRRAREALEEVPKLLEKLRQSMLTVAFRGELTKEWRKQNANLELAEQLLERMRTQGRASWEQAEVEKMRAKGKEPKNDRWKAKYKEAEPLDTGNLPELPKGWCWATLAQVSTLSTGSTPPGKVEGAYGGEVAFFKPTDLNAGFQLKDARQSLSELGLRYVRCVPKWSTLLTCIGSIGKCGFARVDCGFNQQINAMTSFPGLEPRFLYWWICSPMAQLWMRDNASATTLPILNKGRLSRMPVPIAPASEQRALVEILEDGLAEHPRFLSSFRELMAKVAELDASILDKAICGELVAQEPLNR